MILLSYRYYFTLLYYTYTLLWKHHRRIAVTYKCLSQIINLYMKLRTNFFGSIYNKNIFRFLRRTTDENLIQVSLGLQQCTENLLRFFCAK